MLIDAIISAELTNEIGLHARPSVKLTQLAKCFGSLIEMSLDQTGPWVDAKSPVKIMRVKAPKGSVLHFRAAGTDADKALLEIAALITRKFDED